MLHASDGSYMCISVDVTNGSWTGESLQDQWTSKKVQMRADMAQKFGVLAEHVVVVARDQKTGNWFD